MNARPGKMPPGTFIPILGRKWHGTGVARTLRKYKQPTVTLMAITMDKSEEYSRGKISWQLEFSYLLFCPFKSVATPAQVDTILQEIPSSRW